jgi:putative ABC transport system ATP-binding protein
VGLDASFLDRVADDLSGGEAQRMCIARTLLTTPDVILMDEPTSSLDPENRLGIEALARELATEGIGVVWITHDLDQVDRIADRAFVLIDGRNASEDETAAYLTRGMPEEES